MDENPLNKSPEYYFIFMTYLLNVPQSVKNSTQEINVILNINEPFNIITCVHLKKILIDTKAKWGNTQRCTGVQTWKIPCTSGRNILRVTERNSISHTQDCSYLSLTDVAPM